jgi:polyhydroxybutyrate depolymerase
MRRKIIGIFVCMLLITTCVVTVCGTLSESEIKKSSVSPGDYLKVMFFGMRLRSYRIHVPPSYNGLDAVPLVVVLHGFPDNAHDIQSIGMNAEADKEGFIVVYPNGHTYSLRWALMNVRYAGTWGFFYNCWDFDNVDDVGFIRTLIEKLQTTLEINSSRIYITGLSGGALMTYRLGAELSDILAAIAPVAGSIGGEWSDKNGQVLPLYIIPEPEHPLPVIIFHGMNDSVVLYDGGTGISGDTFLSVNESVAFWVNVDHCDPTPQINISKSGNIIRKTYANESQGTEVVLYSVVDGVHGWFGGTDWPYEYPCEISCNKLIWDFFAAHPKQ